jgi:murein DD-endopeptidase MepM/ murein hydrolase activator NlpD
MIILLFFSYSLLPVRQSRTASEVTVVHQKVSEGRYVFIVSNNRSAPYQLSISFSEFVNMRADANLPVEIVVPVGMKDYNLFHIQPTASPYSFTYSYKVQLGDPRSARNDDRVRYVLPFEQGTSRMLLQGYNGDFSHKNTFALDFQMPEGTVVRAARSGVVVAFKNDGARGGMDKALESEANHVSVYHSDGSFAEYVHLKYMGALVQIGTVLKAGDPIGLSGNTGYSSQPHLHFAVYLPGYFAASTVPVRFAEQGGESLQPGMSYTATSARN